MKLINFYEVQNRKGDVEWGGASSIEAMTWFRRGLDSSIFVSVWDEEDIEEPKLVTDKIDITNAVMSALMTARSAT
jgi:hypothetical protein